MQREFGRQNKVMQALTKYLPQGSRVLLAVSGGADSMALAMGAVQLMGSGYIQAAALHVEHGLRGDEALRDAHLVQDFCTAHKLPCNCRHVDVTGYAKLNGLSIENAARKLRYAALQEEAEQLKMNYIATAHHADDQAETVLLKLLRGASAAGLSAMSVINCNIIRPFLELTRADLVSYCDELGVKYCHDSSNDDAAYTRNRVRKELLPYLEQGFNPAVRQTLIHTAAMLGEDEAYFNELVQGELERRMQQCDAAVQLVAAGWAAMPVPVRKRLLRACYFMAGGSELSYSQTNSIDIMCLKGRSGKRLCLNGRIIAAYAYDKLQFISKCDNESAKDNLRIDSSEFAVTVQVPDDTVIKTELPEAAVELGVVSGTLQEVLADCGARNMSDAVAKNMLLYPVELVQGGLTLRHRCSGDRFSPYGGAGSKKLKDYLIDKKVPQAERDEKWLLCSGEKILGIFTVAAGAFKQGVYTRWLLAKYIARER